jgi:hypothetical protein
MHRRFGAKRVSSPLGTNFIPGDQISHLGANFTSGDQIHALVQTSPLGANLTSGDQISLLGIKCYPLFKRNVVVPDAAFAQAASVLGIFEDAASAKAIQQLPDEDKDKVKGLSLQILEKMFAEKILEVRTCLPFSCMYIKNYLLQGATPGAQISPLGVIG